MAILVTRTLYAPQLSHLFLASPQELWSYYATSWRPSVVLLCDPSAPTCRPQASALQPCSCLLCSSLSLPQFPFPPAEFISASRRSPSLSGPLPIHSRSALSRNLQKFSLEESCFPTLSLFLHGLGFYQYKQLDLNTDQRPEIGTFNFQILSYGNNLWGCTNKGPPILFI